jgi:hypothetical protein
MTFEELDQRFPNGFDDAEILGLTVDYQSRTATLQISLRGNLPNSPYRDQYRQAKLTARDFYYLSIEPPDSDHLRPQGPQITVDGLPEDPANFPLFEHLKLTLPAGAFCCRFYVHDWNSFIHLAAKNAEFIWTEDAVAEGD